MPLLKAQWFARGLAASSLFILLCAVVQAQITGFNNGAGWQLNHSGSAAAFSSPTTLQIVTGEYGEANSAFFETLQSPGNGFGASFVYTLSPNWPNDGLSPADGVTFTIQKESAAALGGPGGYLGYGAGFGQAGITPSIAVAFNVYAKYGRGTTLFINGSVAFEYQDVAPVSLLDPILVTLSYSNGVLTESLVDQTTKKTFTTTYKVDITSVLGGATGYVGFTGGSYSGTSTQSISNFNYAPPGPWAKFRQSLTNVGRGVAGGSTGVPIWTVPLGNPIQSSAAIAADGTVYIGTNGNQVEAIGSNGTIKRSCPTGGLVSSSPAIGPDGTIYAGCTDGLLYAINTDGTLKWTYATKNVIVASPCVDQTGTIYIGSWDTIFYAISPAGSLIWSYTTSDRIYSSPAIAPDGTIYVAGWGWYLYSLDPGGARNWIFTAGGSISSTPAIGADGTIFFGSVDKNIYAVYPGGTLRWKYPTGDIVDSSPAVGADGTIYVGSHDGKLYALLPTGKLKWTFPTGAAISNSSPAIGTDGTIFVASTDKSVYAVSSDGTLKWKVATGNQVITTPAIGADGTLYIGSMDQTLYAFGVHVDSVPIDSITLTPGSVTGGGKVTGTVTLTEAAPAGGDQVALAGGDASSTVPTFVVVPEGSKTATFTVTTKPVSGNDTVQISGSSGGVKLSAPLVIREAGAFAVSIKPTSVTATQFATGAVTLSAPAGPSGDVVQLQSSFDTIASVPSTATVLAGATTVTFPIATLTVGAPETVTITATCNGGQASATITVKPIALSALSLNPSSVVGGTGSVQGRVTINVPAPFGGVRVAITSSNAGVTVPAAFFVPLGQVTQTFPITTKGVDASTAVTITAYVNTSNKPATLTVLPASLSTASVAPTSVVGGTSPSVTGTVALNGPAGPSGKVVTLASSTSQVASVPASVKVASGASTATFAVVTQPVATQTKVTITATLGTTAKAVPLTVNPPALASLSVSPTSVRGSSSTAVTGTVTLTGPASSTAVIVKLKSSAAAASVPASISIPAGKSSAAFTVTHQKVSASTKVTITATLGSISETASLTVTP